MNDPTTPASPLLTLSPQDAAVVDSLLENGAASSGLHLSSHGAESSADLQHLARVQSLLKRVGAAPAPSAPDDLLSRTLAAVQDDRMKLDPVREPVPISSDSLAQVSRRMRSGRWAEIAAMIIAGGLLVAVIIPALGQMRQSRARVVCSETLQKAGTAFAAYATANNNQIPSLAMPDNRNWLHGNSPTSARSNAANLIPLLSGGYLSMTNLYCAGGGVPPTTVEPAKNDLPEIGYSYINLFGSTRPTWDGSHSTIVMADKNPLFVPAPLDPATNPDVNSPNHGGHGNYVLRADKSVTWDMSPNIGPSGDNIWTLGSGSQRRTTYVGTETATVLGDIMLAP